MAAGMALCGLRPFSYTIAAFATTKAIEQIRIEQTRVTEQCKLINETADFKWSQGNAIISLEDEIRQSKLAIGNLSATGNQFFAQPEGGVGNLPNAGDRFGTSLSGR